MTEEEALGLAATIYCDSENLHKVLDPDICKSVAKRLLEVANNQIISFRYFAKEDFEKIKHLARELSEQTGKIVVLHQPLENAKSGPSVISECGGTWEELGDTWVRINGPRGGKWLKNTKTGEVVQDNEHFKKALLKAAEAINRSATNTDVSVQPLTAEEMNKEKVEPEKRGYEFL